MSQHEFSGFPDQAAALSFPQDFGTTTQFGELRCLAADGLTRLCPKTSLVTNAGWKTAKTWLACDVSLAAVVVSQAADGNLLAKALEAMWPSLPTRLARRGRQS